MCRKEFISAAYTLFTYIRGGAARYAQQSPALFFLILLKAAGSRVERKSIVVQITQVLPFKR